MDHHTATTTTTVKTRADSDTVNVHEDHCSTCYRVHCSYPSCRPACCPNDCGSVLHPCKVKDHQLLCPSAIVPCVNVANGCKARLPRHKMGNHLVGCPANIIVCKHPWKRSAVVQRGIGETGVVNGNKDTPLLYDEESLQADTRLLHSWKPSDSHVQLGMAVSTSPVSYDSFLKSNLSYKPLCEENRLEPMADNVRSYRDIHGSHYIFWCLCVVRREEVEDHFRWHLIENEMDGAWRIQRCPNYIYGCDFTLERIVPQHDACRVAYDSASRCLVLQASTGSVGAGEAEADDAPAVLAAPVVAAKGGRDWFRFRSFFRKKKKNVSCIQPLDPLDPLSSLPLLIIHKVMGLLDSPSLSALSRVNSYFRDLCEDLVRSHGVVEVGWNRQEGSDVHPRWLERPSKVWSYTKTTRHPTWTYSQQKEMLCAHMEQCEVLKSLQPHYRPCRVMWRGAQMD